MSEEVLESDAFERANKLRTRGWSVIRGHLGGSTNACLARISKGSKVYQGEADDHAKALLCAVNAVVDGEKIVFEDV